uniref:Histidinol dehydrogenase n=1 Tax=Bicosoecida sp. CB-2014 TaxID=1486930 RepID=A0A7S1CP79_9STRA|eukprot:CAMPEP_0203821788 /NCGR_PEP_ID=MMETSP0115-20131106/44251_1 /ASSEMBLY_ACC=CAM_ASM_000227 /TAXON_ID=33651 /ORGANISM="Bicosoecid sp, Strain ms1" /LENGTH=436 /DNA_ID=CAMNT_0050730817 /DNA_START=22 /DNA_END=1332 /DNA_ORIENTATION=-
MAAEGGAGAAAATLARRGVAELAVLARSEPVDDVTLAQSKEIVTAVREGGEAALRELAVKFGDVEEGKPIVVTAAELEAAYKSLPEEQQALLQRVASRVRAFAEAQRASLTAMETTVPGGRAGHTVAPVDTAGCYAPGGRYPLPSSVIMTVLTARVAGVKQVWVASPRPSPVTLAAAHVSGADAMLAVGGAQAIAAMAYGVGPVPSCDVIVGPGNRWVTAAKALVSGRCAIDMLAGPSECLVLADDTAKPDVVAADLLAQAEHDVDALPILVTVDESLVAKVEAELTAQLATLPTADVARVAVRRGYAVVCGSMDEAIAACDTVAPEHLEVMVRDADEVAKRLNHYGGLFVGGVSAEVFGDYGAGPNHVLPTVSTARYTGGLSVFTFLRVRTYLRLDEGAGAGAGAEAAALARDSAALARLEGLEGHARAAEKRLG